MFFPFVLHTGENSINFLREKKVLTGNERHRVEGVPPVVRDFDGFFGLGFIRHGVPLIICVTNNLLHILWLERVQNIEKIFSVWHAAFGQLVREVLLDLFVFLRHRPDVDH